jgi:hypothetical protein
VTASTKTAEIEVIETVYGEVVEDDGDKLLSQAEAKRLDKQIRTQTDKLNNTAAFLFDLLAQAAEGQIHLALGYNSISDYFTDAVDIAPSDAAERKFMAAMMSGKGLSQRAIAAALNVGVGTVNRDLSDVEKGETVSTDGRTFKPREVVEEAEDATEYHGQVKALTKALKNIQSASDVLYEAFGDGSHFDADINPGDIREGIKEIKAAWSGVLATFRLIGAVK